MINRTLFVIVLAVVAQTMAAQPLYEMPRSAQSGLSSFENPNGIKGNGGKTNKSTKGNVFEWIQPGETKSLLNIAGQGTVQRIWLTIDQNPVKLRSKNNN